MIVTLIAGKLSGAPERRQTSNGRSIVKASVKARLGREQTQTWQVIAYDPAVQTELMRLNDADFLCLQGVPIFRTATVKGEPILQYILHPEAILSLRPEGVLE